MKRIRLLLVTKSTGGVGVYVRRLVKGLNQEKFNITVVCMSENGKEFASELRREYGVQAFNLAMNRYKINPLTDFIAFFQLSRAIKQGNYDVIHAHTSKPGFLTRMASIGSRVPVIYSPHNFAFHEGANKFVGMLFAFLEKIASYFTAKIVTVAEHEKKLGLKFGIGTEKKYEVVPTGIDPQPFRTNVNVTNIKKSLGIPSQAQVIGAIGRLAVPKMPLEFVKVAANLNERFPDLHFVWVGSGPLEKEAQELTLALGLHNVIHWLGHRDDTYELYHLFTVFILLSRWEANPLVVLEAFAAGIPVIATDNLGTREVIGSEKNGILVPVDDTQAVVNSITELLKKPDKVKLLTLSASSQIDSFYTVDAMIQRIENIYLQNVISMQ